jgi:Flp pilus assembly protein TadD
MARRFPSNQAATMRLQQQTALTRVGLALLLATVGTSMGGCAGFEGTRGLERALAAPPDASPAAAVANAEGIALYEAGQWEAAKAKFEEAIQAQPTLAEAHYNLGLVYEALRDERTARKHFVEAANLAPGHKVIWNSPAFRRFGDVAGSARPGDFFSPTTH